MGKKGANVILEKDFQKLFLDKVKLLKPGAIILKNDARYRQGIPDWIVLHITGTFVFEIKAHSKASKQPNQHYYIGQLQKMGYFARFVYPENMQEVLDEIQRS